MDSFLSETINLFQLTDSGRGMKSPSNHSLMTMLTHQMIMEIGNTTDLLCWLSGQASVGFLPLAENKKGGRVNSALLGRAFKSAPPHPPTI
jgi:hypothetical protein